MGRKRNNIIMDRPLVDDYGLDKITTKTRSTAVFQGIIDGLPEYAVVIESGFKRRKPAYVNEWAHLIRSLKNFEATVYEVPEGCAFCSNCGEWRLKNRFSQDKRNHNGLHSWCKACRADHERRMYWERKELIAA